MRTIRWKHSMHSFRSLMDPVVPRNAEHASHWSPGLTIDKGEWRTRCQGEEKKGTWKEGNLKRRGCFAETGCEVLPLCAKIPRFCAKVPDPVEFAPVG